MVTMEWELGRLSSFVGWSGPLTASHSRLSRCGFYYKGPGHRVTCYRCQVDFTDWTTVDELLERHRQQSPQCRLAVDPPNNNSTSFSYKATAYQSQVQNAASQDPSVLVQPKNQPSSSVKPVEVPLRVVADRSKNPDFTALRSEASRLETFHDWPSAAARIIDPHALVQAGLFYTGHGDRVQCAFCRGFLRNWVRGDNPIDEHRKHFPVCSFIKSYDAGSRANDRANDRPPSASQQAAAAEQPASLPAVNRTTHSTQTQVPSAAEPSTSTPPTISQGTSNRRQKPPRHAKYVEESARIRSFDTGRVGNGQTARGLAAAGFFFAGPGDNVRCFWCDGGLKNWQPTDDPATEHARWFPRCPFIATSAAQTAASQQRPSSNVRSPLTDQSRPADQRPSATTSAHQVPRNNVSAANNVDVNVDDETRQVLDENRQLREARTCKVCMDRDVDTVFLPCGHLVCCSNCSPELRNCAVCRSLIRGTVKIFLS